MSNARIIRADGKIEHFHFRAEKPIAREIHGAIGVGTLKATFIPIQVPYFTEMAVLITSGCNQFPAAMNQIGTLYGQQSVYGDCIIMASNLWQPEERKHP